MNTTANQTYRPLYDASDWNTDTLKTQAENLCESLIKNGCSSSSTGITGVTGYSPSTYTFATASSPSQAQAKFNNVSVNQSNKSFSKYVNLFRKHPSNS